MSRFAAKTDAEVAEEIKRLRDAWSSDADARTVEGFRVGDVVQSHPRDDLSPWHLRPFVIEEINKITSLIRGHYLRKDGSIGKQEAMYASHNVRLIGMTIKPKD